MKEKRLLLSIVNFFSECLMQIIYFMSMKIPAEKFEEIAHANDIIDVVSEYILVKKRGKSFLALCPFHPDKNPSLHISQEKQVYHCFSCKASGNVYTFVQNFEKITFIDAVKKLAERAGIQLKFNDKDPDLSNEISKLFEINKAAAKYFHRSLQNLSGNEKEFVYNYLDKRKVDSKTIDKFGIGYAKNNWEELRNFFLEENIFTVADVESAGLIIESEKEKSSYHDRFRGRLMFPIFNENAKIVAFTGRKLFDEDPGGKYINSPETKIYNKSKILYGLNFAKEKIKYSDSVILVEGQMDLISLFKNGIENVVASSGTALTAEQVKLISRYTKNICMLFDSDFAGVKAAKRGIEIILEAGLDINIVTLPEGEDPDSCINKNGTEKFNKLISEGKSVINFISDLFEKENKLETVNDKTLFVKEIIGYIGKIPDKIKRAFYIKEISKKYYLYESDIRDELEKIIKENTVRRGTLSSVVLPEKKITSGPDTNAIILPEETDLVDLFINGNDEAILYLENNIEMEFIKHPTVLKLIEYFLNEYIDHGKIVMAKALNDIDNEESRVLISKIAASKHEASYFDSDTSETLLVASVEPEYNLKFAKDVIKRIRLRNMEEKRAELKKNPDMILEVFEISKRINELRKTSE